MPSPNSRTNRASRITVMFAMRRRGDFASIENLFEAIGSAMPPLIDVTIARAPSAGAKIAAVARNIQWGASLRDCDVVHLTGDVHYATLLNTARPVVLTIHDVRFVEEARGLKRLLLRLLWLVLPIRRAGAVTVISEFTKARVLQVCNVPPERVRVVPNCVSASFVPSEKQSPSAGARLLQVGTTSNKNIERLAGACEGMHVRLVFLGSLDDAQRSLLENRKLEFEEHSGLERPEVVALYQSCTVVVCVSTYEGFGMPIIEGQAVGIPVVASNISPMREVAGAGAILVDPFDVNSIREGLTEALLNSDRRQKLVSEGFENVRRYSAQAVAAQYAAIYRELVPTV